jgi:hypothetical protein
MVYVGVSAGAIATASRFGETYHHVPKCSGERLSTEGLTFDGPDGEFAVSLVMADGAGLVDFAIVPHVEFDDPKDAANAEKWAAGCRCPRTRSTTPPPSRSSTARSRSCRKAAGSCSTRNLAVGGHDPFLQGRQRLVNT